MDPEVRWVDPHVLHPNSWNPNEMDRAMYDRAVASIRKFGFVDPITTRGEEIVDGENRWKAALDLDLDQVLVVDLGDINDVMAKELTIVLNEVRGQPNPAKLAGILRDLMAGNTLDTLIRTLPFDRDSILRMADTKPMTFDRLGEPPSLPKAQPATTWVERIYRMPADSAGVLDAAFSKWRQENDGDGLPRTPDWQILEYIAADFLAN